METSTTVRVPGGLDASSAARRWLREYADWPAGRLRDDVALMLSEVVTNAVLHGSVGPGAEVRIEITMDARVVSFRVYDHGAGFTPPVFDEPPRRRGLGLFIVDGLAHRWGVTRATDGACVWFEALLTAEAHA